MIAHYIVLLLYFFLFGFSSHFNLVCLAFRFTLDSLLFRCCFRSTQTPNCSQSFPLSRLIQHNCGSGVTALLPGTSMTCFQISCPILLAPHGGKGWYHPSIAKFSQTSFPDVLCPSIRHCDDLWSMALLAQGSRDLLPITCSRKFPNTSFQTAAP